MNWRGGWSVKAGRTMVVAGVLVLLSSGVEAGPIDFEAFEREHGSSARSRHVVLGHLQHGRLQLGHLPDGLFDRDDLRRLREPQALEALRNRLLSRRLELVPGGSVPSFPHLHDLVGGPSVVRTPDPQPPASVPEPSTLLLVGGGLLLAALRRRQRQSVRTL